MTARTSSRTADRLREVMAATLGVPSAGIGDDFRRESDPAWDSLAHLRLMGAVEEAFGVSFRMAEIPEMTSLRALVDVIEAREPR